MICIHKGHFNAFNGDWTIHRDRMDKLGINTKLLYHELSRHLVTVDNTAIKALSSNVSHP